jgi:predicted transcriptional regulator
VSAVHYTAIETLRYTLGLDEDRIDYYQSLRVLRHRDIYGPDFAVDEDDLGEAISEAAKLLKETIEWLSSVHPDLV